MPRLRPHLIAAVGYFALAGLGLTWSTVAGVASPIWPAAGFALWALLRFGPAVAPAVFVGSFAAFLVFASANPVASTLAMAAGNALAAVAAAAAHRRIAGGPESDAGFRGAIGLIAATLVSALVAATIGVAALDLIARAPVHPQTWAVWFFGDAAGAVVFAPLLLFAKPAQPLSRGEAIHLGLCLATAAGVSAVAFFSDALLLPYHLFVPLIWSALALRRQGAVLAMAVTALIATAGALTGHVPGALDRGDPVLLIQQFLVIAGVTTLLLAAATDERRAESKLRESRRRLDFALDAANMIGWEVDPATGTVAHFGDVSRILGGTCPDAESFYRLVHPEDRDRVRAGIVAGMAAGGYAMEYRILLPDGTVRWMFDRGQRTSRPDGRMLMTGVNTDITQRKLAELALAEERERLRLAQEATGVGVWEMRFEPRELFWAAELYPLWDRDPALGPPGREEFETLVHPDDLHNAMATQTAVKVGDVYDGEFRVRTRDGGWRWLSARARLLSDASGRPDRWLGVNVDITKRKLDEERQKLLTAELDHRVKNILATIQALVARTAATKGSASDLASTLQGRVQAMARAHAMLARNRWDSASLTRLLADELGPYGLDRVTLDGPDIQLLPRAALSLSLAAHELATNAAKYGALSAAGGRVRIGWRIARDGAVARLVIDWAESGGPALAGPPARSGFGTTLTDRVIRHEFGGELALDFAPGGLVAHIELPLDRIKRDDAGCVPTTGEVRPAPATDLGRLAGRRILVAEDGPLVADALVAMLEEAGASVVGPFAQAAVALAAIDADLDAAVLDINLQGGDAVGIADALAACGVPFVFATGYGDPDILPARLRDRPRLAKPYADAELRAAVAEVLAPEAAPV